MVTPYLIFLGLLSLERFYELTVSRRHLAWARERGGKEFGGGHFKFMTLLHTVFFVSCAGEVLLFERPFLPELGVPMFALVVAAQALRYWAVFSLGPYWNVRVVVVPGARPVTSGPYRYLRHPNYLAVIVEGFAIPLLHSAWVTAAVFSLLNAVLLRARIRCEEQALEAHCDYHDRLGDLPRLIPGWRSTVRR